VLKQVESLKQLLEAAQAEVEDTRADAVRLQEERDDAIRATDDLRLELVGDVETARDETFELQTQLDETHRQLEDVRDEARDEAYRASEEKSELQRELDERTDEVRRLRARLANLTTEIRPSQPPPPAALKQLEAARAENQTLRKQLIDAKRELSRASREAGMSRTSRTRRSGALGLRVGADGKQGARVPTNAKLQAAETPAPNDKPARTTKPT
jgi:chromosome segregation ATPase